MVSRLQKTILILLMAALLWAGISLAAYTGWVHGADHRDFYPWWAGARLRLFEGRDLYSLDTVREMQLRLYGKILPPEMDQQGFAYPAQMLVILFPFWWVADREIATALWEGLSVLLLLASLYFLGRMPRRPVPIFVLAAFLLWQYPLLMIFQGQITGLILVSLLLGFWAYQHGKDILSGLALSLAVLKPELALLPWLVMLFMAFKDRRFRMPLAFFAAQAFLLASSMLLAGWWIPEWLAAVQRYSGYAKSAWAPLTAWSVHPLLFVILLLMTVGLLVNMRWNRLAAFAAAFPVGLLLLPQTLVWGLTILLAPLILAWNGRARWVVAAVWLLGWIFLFLPPPLWRWQSLILALYHPFCINLEQQNQRFRTIGPLICCMACLSK